MLESETWEERQDEVQIVELALDSGSWLSEVTSSLPTGLRTALGWYCITIKEEDEPKWGDQKNRRKESFPQAWDQLFCGIVGQVHCHQWGTRSLGCIPPAQISVLGLVLLCLKLFLPSVILPPEAEDSGLAQLWSQFPQPAALPNCLDPRRRAASGEEIV